MTDRGFMFLVVLCLVLGTLLLIFAMKYWVEARQNRAGANEREAHRQLAERAVKAEEETAETLASLRDKISAIEIRLGEIEKLLKEVS